MRYFFTLLLHEYRKLFLRPSTYFISAFFLLLMGFNYLFILAFSCHESMDICTLQAFFESFWLPTLFIVPLLTMKTFAEEQRLGLLESTLSTPIGTRGLVASKFLAAYGFYLMLWTICLFYPLFSQHWLSKDLISPLWTAQVLKGGMVFIALTSSIFIAVGVLTSSLTQNQLMAGLMCFGLLFCLFIGFKSVLEFLGPQYALSPYLNFFQTLEELCQGVFDSRAFVVYSIICVLSLGLTSIFLELKNCR